MKTASLLLDLITAKFPGSGGYFFIVIVILTLLMVIVTLIIKRPFLLIAIPFDVMRANRFRSLILFSYPFGQPHYILLISVCQLYEPIEKK